MEGSREQRPKRKLLEAVTEEILEKEAELKNRRKELEKELWDFGTGGSGECSQPAV